MYEDYMSLCINMINDSVVEYEIINCHHASTGTLIKRMWTQSTKG